LAFDNQYNQIFAAVTDPRAHIARTLSPHTSHFPAEKHPQLHQVLRGLLIIALH